MLALAILGVILAIYRSLIGMGRRAPELVVIGNTISITRIGSDRCPCRRPRGGIKWESIIDVG
jgi:hypothetical protein